MICAAVSVVIVTAIVLGVTYGDHPFSNKRVTTFPAIPSFSATIRFPPGYSYSGGTWKIGTTKFEATLDSDEFAWLGPSFANLQATQVLDLTSCGTIWCKIEKATTISTIEKGMSFSMLSGSTFSSGAFDGFPNLLILLFSQLPTRGELIGTRTVGGQECAMWHLFDPQGGDLSVCIGPNAVFRSLYFKPNEAAVGTSNLAKYTLNMTFHDIQIGSVGDIKSFPGNPQTSPCNSSGVKSFNVYRSTGFYASAKAPITDMFDRNFEDLAGTPVTFKTFGGKTYIKIFKVTADTRWGLRRDCLFGPETKKFACSPALPGFEKLVTRSSSESLTNDSPYGNSMGACDENAAVGSWYTFPSDGKCDAVSSVGDGGCTWKQESSFKVILSSCMLDFNNSGFARAVKLDKAAPMLNVIAHVEAAVEACPNVTQA